MAKKITKNIKEKRQMTCLMNEDFAHKSFGMLIIGVLVLINVYWRLLNWPAFIGWVLILVGFLKLIMHKKCI